MRNLLLPLTLGLAASSCVEQDNSIFIEGALPFRPLACAVAAADQVFLPSGVLDLGAAGVRGYTAGLKVRTNLPSTFNNQDVQLSRFQSPNYTNYGPVDNNVTIFQTAELELTFVTDAETAAALNASAADLGLGEQFNCEGGLCTVVAGETPASGTVFNVQTNLNAAQVVTVELLPGDVAATLREIFDGAGLTTVFPDPSRRIRLNVEASLIGNTTGSGALRPVRSFPFPFGIDVCFGCLNPSQTTCEEFTGPAVSAPVALGNAACFVGQDFAVAQCGCLNAQGQLNGRVVTDDPDVCAAGG